MAWTKETVQQGDNEITRYKNGTEYVPTNKVPSGVVAGLEGQKDGFRVDELGDQINPDTDTDESTDESLPTKKDTPPVEDESTTDDADEDQDDGTEDEDEGEDDSEEEPTSSTTTAKPRPSRAKKADNGDGEEGMGFKRVDGKTVDIFDGKTPHTHVRNVAGIMVPLTQVNAIGDSKNEIDPKTDSEIIEKLKKLGKL